MNSNIWITVKKELRGILRDKKYLAIILLYPFIIPLYIILIGSMYDAMDSTTYIIGTNYSLNNNEQSIIYELSDEVKIEVKENISEKKLKKMMKDNEIHVYIIKEDNTYTVYSNSSDSDGIYASDYAIAYLNGYNQFLATNYLIGEDIDPEIAFSQIDIQTEQITEEGDYLSNMLLQLVITFISMIIIVTAQNTATDIIAGEKERGTLETILTFPIKSNEFVAGKFLAITISCLITASLGIILTIPSMLYVKSNTEVFKDVQFNLEFLRIALAFIIVILQSLLTAGLSIALTGKAKSFKEAQSATAVLLVPAFIAMFIPMLNIKTNLWISLIPISNCSILLNDVFFTGVNIMNIFAMILSSILYIILMLVLISKQYQSERTLF